MREVHAVRRWFTRWMAVLGLVAGAVGGPAAARADLVDLVSSLSVCLKTDAPRIAVMGFARTETAVPDLLRDPIRLEIERAIVAAAGQSMPAVQARLVPVTSVAAALEIWATSGQADQATRERILANQTAFDASIILTNAVQRDADLVFDVVALTRDNACAGVPHSYRRRLETSQAAVDAAAHIRQSVARLVAAAPGDARFAVCRFEAADGGLSPCGDALAERVEADVLSALATRSALTGSGPRVRRLDPCQADPARPDEIVIGGSVRRPDVTGDLVDISLRASKGGDLVAAVAPTVLTGLTCDAGSRTLPLFLDATAIRAPDRLQVRAARPAFRVGERLEVGITVGADLQLYCWYVSPRREAYLMTPKAEGYTVRAGNTVSYPRGFGFPDIPFQAASEDVFGCFGLPAPVSPAVTAAWQAGLGPDPLNPRLLTLAEILQLRALMRAERGAVEAYDRVVVR